MCPETPSVTLPWQRPLSGHLVLCHIEGQGRLHDHVQIDENLCEIRLWLASFPGPSPPEERPGTHCLRMREIFRYIFRKKLCALVRIQKITLTKNTEL